MIERLLTLFERLVVALETMAKAQEAITRVTDIRIVDDAPPAGDVEPGGVVFTPAPATEAPQPPATVTGGTWNPYIEKIQGRYGKDKLDHMDAELKHRGIELKASATGAEKHQALLDWAARVSGEEPAAPAAPAPAAPAAESTQEQVTHDMIRAMAQKLMTGPKKLDAKAVQDLFEGAAGVRRLPEIPEDKLDTVYDAMQALAGV